jgi:hypothetical protein
MIPLKIIILYDEEHLISRTPEEKRNKKRYRKLLINLLLYNIRTRRRIKKQDPGKVKKIPLLLIT